MSDDEISLEDNKVSKRKLSRLKKVSFEDDVQDLEEKKDDMELSEKEEEDSENDVSVLEKLRELIKSNDEEDDSEKDDDIEENNALLPITEDEPESEKLAQEELVQSDDENNNFSPSPPPLLDEDDDSARTSSITNESVTYFVKFLSHHKSYVRVEHLTKATVDNYLKVKKPRAKKPKKKTAKRKRTFDDDSAEEEEEIQEEVMEEVERIEVSLGVIKLIGDYIEVIKSPLPIYKLKLQDSENGRWKVREILEVIVCPDFVSNWKSFGRWVSNSTYAPIFLSKSYKELIKGRSPSIVLSNLKEAPHKFFNGPLKDNLVTHQTFGNFFLVHEGILELLKVCGPSFAIHYHLNKNRINNPDCLDEMKWEIVLDIWKLGAVIKNMTFFENMSDRYPSQKETLKAMYIVDRAWIFFNTGESSFKDGSTKLHVDIPEFEFKNPDIVRKCLYSKSVVCVSKFDLEVHIEKFYPKYSNAPPRNVFNFMTTLDRQQEKYIAEKLIELQESGTEITCISVSEDMSFKGNDSYVARITELTKEDPSTIMVYKIPRLRSLKNVANICELPSPSSIQNYIGGLKQSSEQIIFDRAHLLSISNFKLVIDLITGRKEPFKKLVFIGHTNFRSIERGAVFLDLFKSKRFNNVTWKSDNVICGIPRERIGCFANTMSDWRRRTAEGVKGKWVMVHRDMTFGSMDISLHMDEVKMTSVIPNVVLCVDSLTIQDVMLCGQLLPSDPPENVIILGDREKFEKKCKKPPKRRDTSLRYFLSLKAQEQNL